MLHATVTSVNNAPSTYLQIFDDDPAPDQSLHRSITDAPVEPHCTEAVCTEAYGRPGRRGDDSESWEPPLYASVQSPGLNASVQTVSGSALKYTFVQMVDAEVKGDSLSQRRIRIEASNGVALVNEGTLDRTLPRAKGHRNEALWGLMRALTKWFYPRAGEKAPACDLAPLVIEWHRRGLAKGLIGTQDPQESVRDFSSMWSRCKWPYDEGFAIALIDAAIAENAEAEPIDKIRAMCSALAANSQDGDGTFYLASRLAAEKAGVSARQAAYLIKKLVDGAELIKVEENTAYRAPRYRMGIYL